MSGDFQANLPGLTNPITHAGRVVYNAQRDSVETHQRKIGAKRNLDKLYHESVMSDEDFSIQPYEVCIRNKKSKYIEGNPTDTDIHVFSSANGILQGKSGGDPDNRRKDLAFTGIASNRAIYDPNNGANEEMLAVQVGGLQTIYNTGEDVIRAGDIVVWDMPDSEKDDSGRNVPSKRPLIAGVQRSKLLFRTRPMAKDETLRAAVVKALAKKGEGEVDAVLDALADLRSRVMGKALSSARKGKPFDILLGHYCI